MVGITNRSPRAPKDHANTRSLSFADQEPEENWYECLRGLTERLMVLKEKGIEPLSESCGEHRATETKLIGR
jgi:hypothetical protein